VERLHQWGIQQRRRFRTVQNPLVRVTAREKANSCCSHPDVLAQVDATDARNKRNLPEKKDDAISTKRKQQRDEGRIRALKYFTDIKDVELTWAESIFNDGVGVDLADVGRVGGKRGPGESS
jgi:hypothetical protein